VKGKGKGNGKGGKEKWGGGFIFQFSFSLFMRKRAQIAKEIIRKFENVSMQMVHEEISSNKPSYVLRLELQKAYNPHPHPP
jgi:hypothetical protein